MTFQTPETRRRRWLSWVLIAAAVWLIAHQGNVLKENQERIAAVEEEREHARQRAEYIVASSPYAILMCSEDGRIIISNMAAEQLLGWPHDELLGQPSTVLVPEGDRERHIQGMAKAAAKIRQYAGNWLITTDQIDLTALHRDGTLVPMTASIRVIKYGPTIEFIVAMRLRDVVPDTPPVEPEKPIPLEDLNASGV